MLYERNICGLWLVPLFVSWAITQNLIEYSKQSRCLVPSRCVVWTGDERVFFYNPTTRLSMWDRPDDLIGRADVDKIIQEPPHKKGMDEGKKTSKCHAIVLIFHHITLNICSKVLFSIAYLKQRI